MKFNKILIYINLFFLQAYLIRFKIGPYPTNLQEILITVQIFTFIYSIFKTKILFKTLQSLKKHRIIIMLLILTGLSTLLVSPENKLDYFRHLKFLIFAATLIFIFLETFRTSQEKQFALRITGYGAITFGLFSIIFNLLGYNVAPDHRLLGPLDAAVYLAYYLTPFFIFFTIQSLENPKSKSNLFCTLTLGILILASKSMGAIGGSLLIILIYFFKNNNLQFLKKKITRIILAIFFLTFAVTIFYSKILPTIQTEYSSLDERGEIWLTSIKLWEKPKNMLLGLGFGQFQEQYFQNVDASLGRKPLDYFVLQPHNIFLLFIFQFGLPGLIFIIFCIYKNLANIIKYKNGKSYDNLFLTCNLILLYFFIHGLIDTPFFKNDLLILLILFMELSITRNAELASDARRQKNFDRSVL